MRPGWALGIVGVVSAACGAALAAGEAPLLLSHGWIVGKQGATSDLRPDLPLVIRL